MRQRNRNTCARLAAIVLAALAVPPTLLSCSRGSRESPRKESEVQENRKVSIGFSIDTLALERWQRDLDVFMNRAKELGADVIVQNAGNSVEEQNKQLLYLMERRVDVVVVVAKKRDSLTESIQKLRAKGIAVISYDRLITDADISLYISVSTEKVGELMARQLVKLNAGPRWFCILGPDEDYNMTLIKKGIGKVIAGKGIGIMDTFYTDGWNYDLAYQEAVHVLTGTSIPDAIVCGNDAVAVSVLQAIEDYNPGRHIALCGQDADIAACQNIVQGKQDFTIYKPITQLAADTADYAVRLAKGTPPEELVPSRTVINNGFGDIPVIWLDPQIVTKDNIDEVIVRSGFHTAGEVYRLARGRNAADAD